MSNLVDALTRLMKFDVRDRARWVMNRLAIHSQNKADQRLGVREKAQDVVSLRPKFRSIDFNKTDVVSSGFKNERAEFFRVERTRQCTQRGSSSLSKPLNARMFRLCRHWSHL